MIQVTDNQAKRRQIILGRYEEFCLQLFTVICYWPWEDKTNGEYFRRRDTKNQAEMCQVQQKGDGKFAAMNKMYNLRWIHERCTKMKRVYSAQAKRFCERCFETMKGKLKLDEELSFYDRCNW